MAVNQWSDLEAYISRSHMNSLHEEAFMATYHALSSFIHKGFQMNMDESEREESYLSWVVNSAPGTGKSTALNVLCKSLLKKNASNQHEKYPLLLVFNNNDTMKNNVYKDVSEFAKQHEIPDAIAYVNSDEIHKVIDTMRKYQILCIPQQRLRDLMIDDENMNNYLIYYPQRAKNTKDDAQLKEVHKWKQLVIIDEMPIYYDSCVWDIGSKDNSFDWFEHLADRIHLSNREFKEARDILSELINLELKDNVTSHSTLRLNRLIEGSERERFFNTILTKLADAKGELKDMRRYTWFMKMYAKDHIGCIERTNKQAIICSEWLDYSRLHTHMLILDGTAHISQSIYERSGFELIPMTNVHRYAERLNIRWKNINTSTTLSYRELKEVKEAIAGDFLEIQSKLQEKRPSFKMIALPKQDDIAFYHAEGVITDEQLKQFFTIKQKSDDDMRKHLFNVVGNNDFSSFNAMALFGVPIRPPRHYREIAVAIYGVDIDISLNENRNKENWFTDERIHKLYIEDVLANLSQIIHRTSLRNVNLTEEVDILMYSKRTEWLTLMQKEFRLPDEQINMHQLHNELRFKKACSKKMIEMVKLMVGKKNIKLTAKAIGGKVLYQWFRDNWKGNRKQFILSELKNHNILLFEKTSKVGRQYWLFMLVDQDAFTDHVVSEHYRKLS
ncbi:hypothetical protein UY286_15485 [Paenibacillus polymyxa]|uniref:hypothetical protein n=1 Tax=Paenibacillus polymyxa TaxID=1406 RepID=UPI002AB444BF|nr:hypothetical protein [Paenibacillus polymyxa]MDY7992398.1 hypothetical protein [Paenibacillus polymyxa]MDY8118840.1 hypothetical protein [Paenibacillus polymyxa]